MSIAVPLEELPQRLTDFPVCLVLTNGSERPHLVAVVADLVDGVLRCDVGGSTARNAAAHDGAVTFAFPPADPSGWTLLVDAVAIDGVAGDATFTARPISAVLHRPAVQS